MSSCCCELVLESVTEARHWMLVSVCGLGIFFDDALVGWKVGSA